MEYYKCEAELKIKTEEVEKLKIEVKDLKEFIKLSKELNDVEIPYTKEALKDADVIKNNIENENHTENVSESINLWKNFSKRSNRHKTTSKRKVDSDKEEEEFN